MSYAILDINTLVVYGSVDEARQTAQMVSKILGKDSGVRIRTAESQNVPVYPATFDRSKVTVGGQEVDARIGSLQKNLRAAFPELGDADVSENVKSLDGRNWVVNYQQLLNNLRSVVTSEDVLPRFQEAVALTLRNENLRGVK